MNDFWLGVVSGFFAAIILFACAIFIHEQRVQNVEARIEKLEQMKGMIEEHESIMRTYEFFNEAWTSQMKGE